MSVPLGYFCFVVCSLGNSAICKYTWVCAQAHRPAKGILRQIFFLTFHNSNDRMFRSWVYLCCVCFRESSNISSILNGKPVHAITKSKIRNLIFTSKTDRSYDSFYSSLSKTAG